MSDTEVQHALAQASLAYRTWRRTGLAERALLSRVTEALGGVPGILPHLHRAVAAGRPDER